MNENEAEPWERLARERVRPFRAFAAFRDMGADRSISAVARQLSVSRQILTRWQARFDWNERVEAFDADLDRQRWRRNQQEALDMADRQARSGVAMQARAMQALQQVDAATLGPRDLTYMMDVAVKIERLARGAPSERIEMVGILVTPLVQAFGAIFLEINRIEDPDIRAEEYASRSDVVMEEIVSRFLIQKGGTA